MAERILFVTGRLAEVALREVVAHLEQEAGLSGEVCVLPISVAALMHVDWVRRKLQVPPGITRIILPGWCQGDLDGLSRDLHLPLQLGPKDLRDLPEFFGRQKRPPPDLTKYDIEILAEINHAPRLAGPELLRQAHAYRASGADIIDLGCIPGETWSQLPDATRRLRSEGFRVSVDSFDRREVESAVGAGAELVLSCNRSNRDWLATLPVELVVIPDDLEDLETLAETVACLDAAGAKYRLDPVLEPIGFGFAKSLGRYLEVRRRWPSARMMMGIGNLTELTEVDSAGINMLLAGFCQELGIGSVLTTEVIGWCRTAVKEFDLARRVVRHAVTNRVLPKHVDSGLVMLRDARVHELGSEALDRLAAQLRDPNFRLFAERGHLHLLNRDGHRIGTDPFEIFDRLGPLDPAHAFYLGYEFCKAVTALTLGKNYRQDEALDWGFLTVPEQSAVHRRKEAADHKESPLPDPPLPGPPQ